MNSTESEDRTRLFATFAAFVSIAFAVFILAGWTFDIDVLTNLVPNWPRVSRLTALGFLLSGIALSLSSGTRPRLAIAAAVLLIMVGLSA